MPYAIVMLIEETAAPRIATLWHALAERDGNGQVKFSDEQVRFNYPPHITLATVDDTADPDVLVETLKAIVAGWKPVPVASIVLPSSRGNPSRRCLRDQT